MGVKRWLLIILLGTTLLGVGLGIMLLEIYRTAPDTWWLPALSTASLRFLPRPLRVIIFGGLGIGLVLFGILELNRAIIKPFLRPGDRVATAVRSHRQRGRGPRVVAIGGGHGLAALLRGIKPYTNNITAIVTMADDGGSSGRLRQELGILPPGDIRNCLAALSSDEALLAQLFQYRFGNGNAGLDGHSFGNLFISALADITGSFESAVAESGKVLATQGQVLPSTLHDVRLQADVRLPHTDSQVRIYGESQIPMSNGKVRHVWIEPENPPAFPQAIQAILAAELIVVGPGSLYTSILPNLLVPDLMHALRASRALKLFICNVATEKGETTGYNSGDHIRVIEEHISDRLFDVVIANRRYEGKIPATIDWVRIEPGMEEEYSVYAADLVDNLYPWRHDSTKLGQAIMDIFQERTGPLVE
ncbi:MAG: uridine diphosphate-N-acetylglucosamine-binding protein YvcK [Anaerolineales bacterium]|nr:uridine diphosphate-N-acetylglucosamine-binding protein YvcK [Anaerolineales bacterium]